MKKYYITFLLVIGILMSCEDFLERPAEDSYTIDNFYQNNEQLFQAVNTIYNSPWYDFQRGFLKIGDVMGGNIIFGVDDEYTNFAITNSSVDIANASASLWSVNAYCNGVIENIETKSGPEVTQKAKNTVKGEALVWKSMAYFYLVRVFGAVPIVHNNGEIIANNTSTTLKRNKIENVYQYIVYLLEDAIELLPEENEKGRIDKYSACGLLSKVYLTKSGYGMNGTRNEDDLAQAAKYAKLVIDKSGRVLEPNYEDIFQLKGNFSEEGLITWRWTVGSNWTCQNSLQSDLSLTNFSDAVQSWGGWVYPTIDLQSAFNDTASSLSRNNQDSRRKATIMMYGDHYDYFWVEFGGFDYNWDNASDGTYGGELAFANGTGSNCAKHIVGRIADAEAQGYSSLDRMHTPLATHILRLADVYLIYAEAVLGNNSSTSDASALAAYNDVRRRAIGSGYTDLTSITFDDIDLERRLELAMEGDRWYDLVRLHYYKPEEAIRIVANQERGSYSLDGLDNLYVNGDDSSIELYTYKVTPTNDDFEVPFTEVDLSLNPGLMDDPVDFDFSSIGY